MHEIFEKYQQSVEKMHPSLEEQVKRNETPLSDNRAFPEVDELGNKINFEEFSAYKRFLDCIETVKHYTGVQNPASKNGLMQLQTMMMQTVPQIFQIQSQHKQQLEDLAVNTVVAEMEIPEGAFQFDVELVQIGQLSKDKFQEESKEPTSQEIENIFGGDNFEGEFFETPADSFNKEKQKRRFSNALVQGSAKKGHFMFELVRNQLNEINPNLADMYGVVMSVNDLMYWVMPDEQIQAQAGESVNGEEEINTETDPPTIIAKGIFFPVLLHEIIKGISDVFATHGLPDDPKSQQMVMDSTDTLSNEVWDLRIGAIFWERLLDAFPVSVYEEGRKHFQHYLFARLVALDTNEFFEVFQNIMSGNSEGKKFVEDMLYDIEKDMSEKAMNESLGEYDFRMDDEDEESDYFEDGEEVSWEENALEELQEYEDDDDLEITNSSSIKNSIFYASNGDAEYIVFKSYEDAYDYAYERVEEDLYENPQYFNENWLKNQIDYDEAKTYLTDVYNEWNTGYANDIKLESDSKYPNRLIDEMVDAGIMDEKEANSEDAEEIAEDYMVEFVEYMTDDQIAEDSGIKYYEDNFGSEDLMSMIMANNLLDISGATENALNEDGVPHFISTYDGNEIQLDSGYQAYRIN